ncbi:MAG: YIP1 family protein [Gemmatimonadota bacterium]
MEAQNDAAAERPFPWPPCPGASALEAFVTTWREACFRPTSFFRRMPPDDSTRAVLVYYLVLGVIVAGINLFWTAIFDVAGVDAVFMPELAKGATNALVEFLLSPLILMATLLLVSGVCHLVLLMAGASAHGFGATVRVFAFSYSPAIFAIVPFLGSLVAFVWMIVIAIIGLREAQKTSAAKAALAVLLPTFLLFALIVLALVVAATAGLLKTRF